MSGFKRDLISVKRDLISVKRDLIAVKRDVISVTRDLINEIVCQALKINPRRQEAWNNLGILQRDAGEYEAQIKGKSTL